MFPHRNLEDVRTVHVEPLKLISEFFIKFNFTMILNLVLSQVDQRNMHCAESHANEL